MISDGDFFKDQNQAEKTWITAVWKMEHYTVRVVNTTHLQKA